MANELVVKIIGDSSSLERSFKKSAKSANTFERSLGGASRGTVAASGAFRSVGRSLAFASGSFLSAAAVTAVLRDSISGASDLEQQVSKTNVVFGKSAEEVEAWSKTLATSFGLSEREALTLASTFGALFAPLGIVGKQAAEQSRDLVELGADLASFYNTDVQDALDAIQSGLVGQARPLRRYGVLLDAARVQQEALNETGKANVKNLTNQEKVLARISLLFQDSKKAQGDFARTSGQAAQQAKILRANISNLEDELGATLLPTLNKVVTSLNEFVRAASGGQAEGPVTGQKVETTLVPVLAARIAAYKKAGLQGKEILRMLRLQIGDSQKANDLIAEAFTLSRDPKLRERLRRQAEEAKKAVDAASKVDLDSPGRRRAREAVRQQVQDQAELAVERTQLTKSLRDDIAANEKLNELLKRRIKGGHASIQLRQQQLQVELTINSLLEQQAQNRRDRREAIRQAAEDARAAALEARNTRQFRILGFGPGGADIVPGVKSLKRQLASITDAIEGSLLDTTKTRQKLRNIRRVLAEGVGHISADVRAQIEQMIQDLQEKLKNASVDVTRFNKTASGQFVTAGAHGAGSHDIVVQGGIHLHGIQNMKQLENELTKRHKQRGRQRRSTR